jgi:hypothetical protein
MNGEARRFGLIRSDETPTESPPLDSLLFAFMADVDPLGGP